LAQVIVIDVGSARHPARQVSQTQKDPEHFSIERLVDRFHPDLLYAFDPHPGVHDREWALNGTQVVERRQAAWLHDGTVQFDEDGAYSRIGSGAAEVFCFRLSDFICALPDAEIVLKLDCESAEYELLEDLVATGAAGHLSKVLVEWHGERERDALAASFGDRLEEWSH